MRELATVFRLMAGGGKSRGGAAEGRGARELSAEYLARVLRIPPREAEEIVFLADLDRFAARDGASPASVEADAAPPTIDLVEFHRLIVGWA